MKNGNFFDPKSCQNWILNIPAMGATSIAHGKKMTSSVHAICTWPAAGPACAACSIAWPDSQFLCCICVYFFVWYSVAWGSVTFWWQSVWINILHVHSLRYALNVMHMHSSSHEVCIKSRRRLDAPLYVWYYIYLHLTAFALISGARSSTCNSANTPSNLQRGSLAISIWPLVRRVSKIQVQGEVRMTSM